MHNVAIHSIKSNLSSQEYLTVLRAIQVVDEALGLDEAADKLDTAERNGGWAIVAEDEDGERAQVLAREANAGADGLARFAYDRPPAWLANRSRAHAGLTPEEAIKQSAGSPALPGGPPTYDARVAMTAIAVVTIAKGDALAAVAHANTLRNTTGHDTLYGDVIRCLGQTFSPWLPKLIDTEGKHNV